MLCSLKALNAIATISLHPLNAIATISLHPLNSFNMIVHNLLCLLQLFVVYETALADNGRSKFLVDTSTNKIVDTQGRQRFFHGTNVVYKTDPFIPITTHFDAKESFCEEDADLLASMGYNTIRLGVLWAG